MIREIGLTGKKIFPIGLGSKPLSMGNRPTENEAIKVLHTAFDLGFNFIDTANVYCMGLNEIGHNEKLIHKAIKQYSKTNEVLIATKGGSRPEVKGGVDCSYDFLKKSCEKSLIDLGIESIFLYQLHAIDPKIPFIEIINNLIDLKKEGKIQHIGLTNVTIENIKESLSITRIESVQNRCNIFYKEDIKTELIEFCNKNKITYFPHSSVGGTKNHIEISKNSLISNLANKYQTSTYCIMISWLLHIKENVIPVVGASKISSIQDIYKSININLSEYDIEQLNNLLDDSIL